MLLAPCSWLRARRSPLLAPSSRLLAFLVFAGCGSISSVVYGQADGILDKTTFGRSQNGPEDLANSLVPGPKRYGKGEKKEEVDLKNLQSKSSKDTTFQGTLMDLDVDWHGNKLGKPKTNDEKDSKAAKSADADGAKDSKVSKQADNSGGKDPKASKSTQAGDGKNKDQKAASAVSTETTSEKEKASATKPDGDH
jgi:hypothetical protein